MKYGAIALFFCCIIGEPVGVDVGFEMMDGVERLVPEDGEHASGEGADEEGAEEAGGIGNGDVINIILSEAGVAKGFVNDGQDSLEVRAGSDFRNNTTICGENVNLRNDDIADDAGVVADDGGGGFVAGTFDGENFHIIYIIACFGRDGKEGRF